MAAPTAVAHVTIQAQNARGEKGDFLHSLWDDF
jgi:hypothetical protein